VILDLDPGDGPWAHLVEVALAVRTLLDALKLESFVKTSGKRGLHVVVPIAPGPTHDQATGFAEQVARAVAKVLPKVATVERMKDKRGGKLYVDYGQNGEGRTIVAPYTIRARDGAVVSTPIRVGRRHREARPHALHHPRPSSPASRSTATSTPASSPASSVCRGEARRPDGRDLAR
jgi:bifunctional non-homologous end joining protein LigD